MAGTTETKTTAGTTMMMMTGTMLTMMTGTMTMMTTAGTKTVKAPAAAGPAGSGSSWGASLHSPFRN
jgi:hypothetical protein